MASLVLSAVLVCLAPTRCAAWGGAAHRVIARIAASQLTPKTRERVAELLGKDDFVGVSTYADEIRILRPDTAGWHFVEIPSYASSYVARRDCLDGDCIVAVVERLQTTLREPNKATRGLSEPAPDALRFLIHLVGDIGQPFHCYEDDRGGNSIKVSFFGSFTNLHAVWDSYMLERMMLRAGLTEQAYADRLINTLKNPAPLPSAGQSLAGQDIHLWAEGKPEDWASESHAIAVQAAALNLQVSPPLPQPKGWPAKGRARKRKAAGLDTAWPGEAGLYSVQPAVWRAPGPRVGVTAISEKYFSDNSLIVEKQLLKSGLRLARLLNDALDGAAQP